MRRRIAQVRPGGQRHRRCMHSTHRHHRHHRHHHHHRRHHHRRRCSSSSPRAPPPARASWTAERTRSTSAASAACCAWWRTSARSRTSPGWRHVLRGRHLRPVVTRPTAPHFPIAAVPTAHGVSATRQRPPSRRSECPAARRGPGAAGRRWRRGRWGSFPAQRIVREWDAANAACCEHDAGQGAVSAMGARQWAERDGHNGPSAMEAGDQARWQQSTRRGGSRSHARWAERDGSSRQARRQQSTSATAAVSAMVAGRPVSGTLVPFSRFPIVHEGVVRLDSALLRSDIAFTLTSAPVLTQPHPRHPSLLHHCCTVPGIVSAACARRRPLRTLRIVPQTPRPRWRTRKPHTRPPGPALRTW